MSLSGEKLIFLAKASLEADMSQEMFNYMKQFVTNADIDLEPEERNLFSSACRGLLRPLTQSYRVLQSIEKRESVKNGNHVKLLQDKIKQVTDEFNNIFKEIMDFISTILLRDGENVETTVFFLKLKADLHRDLYQISLSEQESRKIAEQCIEMYRDAYNTAYKSLRATNVLRLQIALNLSVWRFEIMGDPQKAAEISEEAFNDALANLDELDDDEYHNATQIMQLLRDNLSLYR